MRAEYAASARQIRRQIYDNKRLERIVPVSGKVPPSPNSTRTLEMERESRYQIADQDLAGPHPTMPDMATLRIQQRVCRTTRNINKAQGSNQDLVLWRLVLCMDRGAQERKDKELGGAGSEDQKRAGNKKARNTKKLYKSERC